MYEVAHLARLTEYALQHFTPTLSHDSDALLMYIRYVREIFHCMYMYMYIYIYICIIVCIYIYRERERVNSTHASELQPID